MPEGERTEVDVFCVIGPSYARTVEESLIPALERQEDVRPTLHVVNYLGADNLLEGARAGVTIHDWTARKPPGRIGFGAGVNLLFRCVAPQRPFILANPDTTPSPAAVVTLLHTLRRRKAALVEARQWPFAHPKEFVAETLQTPWASAAFVAVDNVAFAEVGGFDELFFLYNEDVDLSWRLRMAGWEVLYEPDALVHHDTGLGRMDENVYSAEQFYSARNFLALGYKFFGEAGERAAFAFLPQSGLAPGFIAFVTQRYECLKPRIVRAPSRPPDKWIKMTGFNRYHSLRGV